MCKNKLHSKQREGKSKKEIKRNVRDQKHSRAMKNTFVGLVSRLDIMQERIYELLNLTI